MPELAKPSDLLGSVDAFDCILSETQLDNEGIHWNDLDEFSPPESQKAVQGLVIDADISGSDLMGALEKIFGSVRGEQSSDFHKDFGNPMQSG